MDSMSSSNIVERLDTSIANFFQSWNWITTILVAGLIVMVAWPIFMGKDADIHPFLLARQAQASPVRQPGESAIYHANEIPIGYPLRKGLAVKDPGAPRWSAGRDGDLRDVWRQALRGPVDEKGAPAGPRAKLLTVLGRERVVEQDLNEVSRMINTIGRFMQDGAGKSVAVCLPNSVELLVTIFAAVFYGLKPVLVPYGLSQEILAGLLKQSGADFFISQAGTLDLKPLLLTATSIKQVIWVTEAGSEHMDWDEVPEGVGRNLDVSTWHEIIEQGQGKATTEVAPFEKDSTHAPLATFWQGKNGAYELVEYTPANLIAGTAGLMSSLVRAQKLSHLDTLLPLLPLTQSYALCWTFAALYSNASLALNSVSGEAVDLTLAIAGIKPTIIITSSSTISKYADKIVLASSSILSFINNFFQRQAVQAGVLPSRSGPNVPNLSNLRALLVSQPDHSSQRVSSSLLSGLRFAMGVRVGYALTSAKVAGAVSQTNVLDYRDKRDVVNVGVPLTSVEIYLTGSDEKLDGERPVGKIAVRGPAVVGGKSQLDVEAQIDSDHTINLL